MGTHYNTRIPTDGLKMYIDAGNGKSAGKAGYALNLIEGWTDYGSNQAHYSVLGTTKDNQSVLIKNTSTGWIGRFIANPTETGVYHLEFNYYTLAGSGTLVLDNDGIMDNTYNNTYTATTTKQSAVVSVTHTTTGEMRIYFRHNGGSNIYLTNVKLTRVDVATDIISNSSNMKHYFQQGASNQYIDGVQSWDTRTGALELSNTGYGFTFGTEYTLVAWGRAQANSVVSTWRTLWRTYPDDHPLLIQKSDNAIGIYENNGSGFNTFGVSATSYENVWSMYTLVGSGSSTTLYMNDGSTNGTASHNITGNRHFTIGSANGGSSQWFGYVANAFVYERALSATEVNQLYNATKKRFGH